MALDIDRHFRREDLKRYALQCGLAGFVVFILLLVLDAVTQTVLIAALGASAFIAFAVPRSLHSGPRHMIGGYVVGILAGSLISTFAASINVSASADHAVMGNRQRKRGGLQDDTCVVRQPEVGNGFS